MIGEMSDKILWCFNKHYLPSNETEKLADIILMTSILKMLLLILYRHRIIA